MNTMKNTLHLLVVTSLGLVGCAQKPQNVTYIEAAKTVAPTPKKVVMTVPEPVPLPGQLKKKPKFDKTQKNRLKTWQVIEKANKSATQKPELDNYFNSIMLYTYEEGGLYQVYSAPFKLTDIQLQPGEKIIGPPAGGDTRRWKVGRGISKVNGVRTEHVLVKTTRPGLQSTLTINTDRRTYHLELHSYKETYMAAISWNYPGDDLIAFEQQLLEEEREDKIITDTQINLKDYNGNYDIEVEDGDPEWVPSKVFDDGRKTFIQFPKALSTSEAPALFILSSDDQTQLVNYRVKNDFYIVDRLFKRAELRVGQQDQDIVRITRD